MNPRCFVQVRLGAGGRRPAGTGYLVRRDRVLTAAHVVEGHKNVTVVYDREIPPTSSKGGKRKAEKLEAVVCFRGRGRCDIALLRLKEPVGFDVAEPAFADQDFSLPGGWHSKGWALTSPKRNLVLDSLVDLQGNRANFVPDQQRFTIWSESEPQDVTWWAGVSGAAVFAADGSGWLLGVVSEVEQNWKGELKACPMAAATRELRFHRALDKGSKGIESDGRTEQRRQAIEQRRRRLAERLVEFLSRAHPNAVRAMTQSLPWRAAWDAGGAEALVEAMCSEDPIAALGRLNDAHLELWETEEPPRVAARQVEFVAFCLAPVFFLDSFAQELPLEEGPVRCPLPIRLDATADLVLAALDGRPALLQHKPEAHAVGKTRLPLPAEVGLDALGNEMLGAYAAHLEKKVKLKLEERTELADLRKSPAAQSPEGRELILRKLLDFLDDHFDREVKYGDHRRRSYLHFNQAFGETFRPFLDQLGQRLKSIHLLEGRGQDIRRETPILDPLERILERASQPEGKR